MAIGGGAIGKPGTKVETLALDLEIIQLSGRKRPKLLFIPTASSDANWYCKAIQKHFGDILKCKVEILYLINNQHSKKEIEKKILKSDIIYVGGGNTLKMLTIWRKLGVDSIIFKAYENDIVLSGLSAGAICWFRYGDSDSRRFKNPDANLIKIRGLNIINALCCPHYNTEGRKEHVKIIMKKTAGVAIGLDNCSAIECVDNKYRIIVSRGSANAFKLFWLDGKYHEEVIKKTETFLPLDTLLVKKVGLVSYL